MLKAFDTASRNTLFEHLENGLEEDEIHLLSILTRNPEIVVCVNYTLGKSFATNPNMVADE